MAPRKKAQSKKKARSKRSTKKTRAHHKKTTAQEPPEQEVSSSAKTAVTEKASEPSSSPPTSGEDAKKAPEPEKKTETTSEVRSVNEKAPTKKEETPDVPEADKKEPKEATVDVSKSQPSHSPKPSTGKTMGLIAPAKVARPAKTDDVVFGEGGEHEYGRGVGDLLGSVNAVETEKQRSSSRTSERKDDSLPKRGSGKISIESILKKKDAGEPVFDENDNVINEEGMQDEVPLGGSESGHRRRGPVPALLAVLIIIVLVAIAGILMFVRKNGLPSIGFLSNVLGPKTTSMTASSSQQGQTAPQGPQVPSTVSVDFIAAVAKDTTSDTPVLVTRTIETDVELSDTFPATGQQPAPSAKSTGTITIVNTTSRSYTFVATTRFLSPDGILFRMKDPAHIPANGTVDVSVYADKPGPTGDIGPTTFTIPGLSASLQKVITGKSSAAMSGGSGTVKAVTQDDIDKAKASLTDRLKTESEKNFKVMVKDGERIVPDLITSKELSFSSDKPGTPGSTFTAKLSLRFRALLVPESDVLPLLKNKLASVLPPGEDPSAYTLGSTLYTVEAYDTATQRAQIRVEAPVRK